MAHTKAKGSSKLGRDSAGQRLGVKVFGGSFVQAGSIIVRQRGSKFYAGENVDRGKDDTLFAIKSGIVKFSDKVIKSFTHKKKVVKMVNVVGEEPKEEKPKTVRAKK